MMTTAHKYKAEEEDEDMDIPPLTGEQLDPKNWQRNPYMKVLRKPVTLRLNLATIEYFKTMAGQTGIPYQNLMNLFLTRCAEQKKTLDFV
jgi:predicted DNA binding CopG/RHH family protein